MRRERIWTRFSAPRRGEAAGRVIPMYRDVQVPRSAGMRGSGLPRQLFGLCSRRDSTDPVHGVVHALLYLLRPCSRLRHINAKKRGSGKAPFQAKGH